MMVARIPPDLRSRLVGVLARCLLSDADDASLATATPRDEAAFVAQALERFAEYQAQHEEPEFAAQLRRRLALWHVAEAPVDQPQTQPDTQTTYIGSAYAGPGGLALAVNVNVALPRLERRWERPRANVF